MTEVVEVAGGTVTVGGATSGITVDDADGGTIVVGPDGTSVTVDPAVEVVSAGGGTTVVATGTTAIQIVETGGGGGGVTDHGALSGLADDDHPQYFLADGTRPIDGDLTVTGVVPSYWTFSNSPRSYGGVDYYVPGGTSTYVAAQNSSGDWVDALMDDDGDVDLAVYQWTSNWASGIRMHLCDSGGNKVTVLSNRDWATVDVHFAGLYGPGTITADVADVTGWAYSGPPNYTWTDGTGLAVCSPSGSTSWPDPAAMTATILPRLAVSQSGSTAIAGDVAVTGDLHVGGQFYPRVVETPVEPSPPGVTVWHDTDLDEWWLIVNMGGSGNRKVQIT